MPTHKQQGFVLIISVLVLTSLLIVGSYLLSLANSESNISNAQILASQNYYLAETGINDMVWKIQNDTTTRNAFLAGTLNATHDIVKSNIFGDANASYKISAFNTVAGEAWIIATSTYQVGETTSQRVVKTYITRPTGSGTDWDYAIFAGGRGGQQNGNFTFKGSGIAMTTNDGRLHANQVFKVQGVQVVVNDGAVTASNVINVVAGGTLTLNNSYQEAPTSTIDMLQIDFDSSDPNSWKNRATQTYTQAQFQNLPTGTVLNGIIYVTGDAQITGKNMTINGVLVADDDIAITLSKKTLRVNADTVYGGGILAKGDVTITVSSSTVGIEGLIYAGDDLDMTSSKSTFVIDGSMAGFDAEVTASSGSIILNYVPENFQQVVDPIVNPNGPLIEIDHWEEQY